MKNKLPKYIKRKIEKVDELSVKIHHLQQEIDEWFEKTYNIDVDLLYGSDRKNEGIAFLDYMANGELGSLEELERDFFEWLENYNKINYL